MSTKKNTKSTSVNKSKAANSLNTIKGGAAIAKTKKIKVVVDKNLKQSGRKASIHSNYRIITVEMTDGSVVPVGSTFAKDTLKLDIDPKTHSAWTKRKGEINLNVGEVAKFQSKYGGVSFASIMSKK